MYEIHCCIQALAVIMAFKLSLKVATLGALIVVYGNLFHSLIVQWKILYAYIYCVLDFS